MILDFLIKRGIRSEGFSRLLCFSKLKVHETMDLNKIDSSSGSASASQLFTSNEITAKYTQFRPNYTDETYHIIQAFCKEMRSDLELAVDVGCGSGQSTVPLSKYFTKVIGVDVSEGQLTHAPSNIPGLSFQCSPAEHLPFIGNESADLVTVAQAFHWFDREKFFQEADRILRPGGSLVIYGYGNFYLENKDAQGYKSQIYSEVLGKYWHKRREWIDTKYAACTLPYDGWRRDDTLVMDKVWTVDQVVGYISSWSSVNKFLAENPESTLLSDIRSEFLRLYGSPDQSADDVKMKISWPIFLLMGHKPC